MACEGGSAHLSSLVSSLHTRGWFSSHHKLFGDPQLLLLFLASVLPHILCPLHETLFFLLLASAYSGSISSMKASSTRLTWFTCPTSPQHPVQTSEELNTVHWNCWFAWQSPVLHLNLPEDEEFPFTSCTEHMPGMWQTLNKCWRDEYFPVR